MDGPIDGSLVGESFTVHIATAWIISAVLLAAVTGWTVQRWLRIRGSK